MRFYAVLAAVIVLTTLFAVGALVLSFTEDPSDLATSTTSKLLSLAEIGLGGVLGMVSGKTLSN